MKIYLYVDLRYYEILNSFQFDFSLKFMYFSYEVTYCLYTVKREMLAAIIFGGFENITIWLRFNLEISLKESGWRSIFFQLVTTNFGKIYYLANSPNKSSPIIYRFTVWYFDHSFVIDLGLFWEWLFSQLVM